MNDYLHPTDEHTRPQEPYRWETVSFAAPRKPDIPAGSFQRQESEERNKETHSIPVGVGRRQHELELHKAGAIWELPVL